MNNTSAHTPNNDLLWYKDAIIYELHIKAFCDSNGDGIGDIEGLISRLDYLQSLGITAIWLLPFYPSPQKDDGYDIADYYNINPAYGTIEQFKTFLDEAHKRGLKVITELVINHTSDQHPWFQRARKAPKDSPERHFYVWTDNPHQYRDVRIIFQDFETSNWTWDPESQQYYWHRFFHHQPDLNYDNPLVQQEVFNVLDYWCAMGVDGFRLDAVPYLFEREGTNGENLPETHAFLKKLRAHIDANYPGTLLLAEANMWPEDSASYFGNGDECHMNYHFPVMPRIFMALQREDRYPITDIFDQTPEIPETCQWAMFLRNHDELTLEMVTDEERDYMYKVYVKDPKARINLGIRHRLAPLMENNRKKIELLHCLLFSLPGTPVLYYGDEIGMGDNFYLGDRNGVRTPMQWNSTRNAGFSDANPHMLYLPVILDPEYHYESVNVEIQERTPSSLLWWTRKLVHMRSRYKAFSRGKMTFITNSNARVLSFIRTYEEQMILVLVNLSSHIQPVELDLGMYGGYIPVEVFSKNAFPPIGKEQPYFLTISAHECQWFLLTQDKKQQEDHSLAPPQPEVVDVKELFERPGKEILESSVLPGYLQRVRWFGGKAKKIQRIHTADVIEIPSTAQHTFLLLLEVSYEGDLPEIYQLPITYTIHKEKIDELQAAYPKAMICEILVNGEKGILYDAAFDDSFREWMVTALAEHKMIHSPHSDLIFSGDQEIAAYAREHAQKDTKVLSAEQSNTSLAFGERFFVKLYRKVDHAINPDLEITRFLTEHTGFAQIPAFAGVIERKSQHDTMVLAMIQNWVGNTRGDAWTYMLGQIKAFYTSAGKNEPGQTELSPEVSEKIKLLGTRTAEMHLALASKPEIPEFKPEYFSLHYQRSLFSSFQSLVRATFDNLQQNMHRLPDNVRKEAAEIIALKPMIIAELKKIYRKKIDVVKIRVHGDYHLGQVLLTDHDLVILDFEGEPARSYSERRLKRSAFKDVAGMLRSFHYAAYGALFLGQDQEEDTRNTLMPFAEQWYAQVSDLFMNAYLETAASAPIVPPQKEDTELLLQTSLLEKAIYELNYELNNRPEWIIIPIRGIKAIMNE